MALTNLPDTPVNSTVLVASLGMFAVAGFFIKKSSDDRQHQASINLEAKKIDAQIMSDALSKCGPKTNGRVNS